MSAGAGIGPVGHAAEFVQAQLRALPRDGSHDWWHIYRVHRMAVALAREEGLEGEALLAVELAALLHDVQDWKYSEGSDPRFSVEAFLDTLPVDQGTRSRVLSIIAAVGFKEELAGGQRSVPLELGVVQDADRLDAIGAIGIARCFTFGGHFGRCLHDPAVPPREGLTVEQYRSGTPTTLNHFHEKLLKLKGLMKTGAGRRRAESRHRVLVQFLDQFHLEWEAND